MDSYCQKCHTKIECPLCSEEAGRLADFYAEDYKPQALKADRHEKALRDALGEYHSYNHDYDKQRIEAADRMAKIIEEALNNDCSRTD